jgi:hypothetical protein
MSVYYYKGAQILAPYTIRSNEPMYDVDTVSLKKQRASQNAQRWEISFNTAGTVDTVQDMLIAAVNATQLTDTMVMPQLPAVDEKTTISTASLPVAVAGAIGDTSVVMQVAGPTGLFPKGSFFKFNNHDKIYMTTSDTSFDGGTNVTMNFYPKLRSVVTTSNSVKNGSQCTLTYYKSIDNMAGVIFTDGVLSNSGTIELIEAL